MTRKIRHLIALAVVAVSMGAMNVAVSAAEPPHGGENCPDLVDHGGGNIGDPGDGQEHHNESNGVGNAGDPGNGQGHFCAIPD
ncbi:MAG TPA: hypothetical protein VHY83_05765 [Solirubrobacteraceae bacterium]|jgi:hypothetical protein|nr:hypothetical protein [Solirubrobacteraceae bacterium]